MKLFKYGPVKAIFALFTVFALLPSVLSAADRSKEENIALQNAHMGYLENDFYNGYVPREEKEMTGFDVQSAVNAGVKFNEVRFIGTHNSYQLKPTEEYAKLRSALDVLTFSLANDRITEFYSDYLTEQFELGIRSIELDIETVVSEGETHFAVSHEPFIDITSNCYDLSEALREIKLWSDHNPGHLPITVIIEPKKNVMPINGMVPFTLKYAVELDALLRSSLGDTLLTPADMTAGYASFAEMRADDGWLMLEKTLGRVLVLLHDTTVTNAYIKTDETVKTQAMFPMLRFSDIDKPYASFIIDNDPASALSHNGKTTDEYKLIVRTRADSFTSFSDTKYQNALNCGSQILSTDYPVKTNGDLGHVFDFGGATVELNS